MGVALMFAQCWSQGHIVQSQFKDLCLKAKAKDMTNEAKARAVKKYQ